MVQNCEDMSLEEKKLASLILTSCHLQDANRDTMLNVGNCGYDDGLELIDWLIDMLIC